MSIFAKFRRHKAPPEGQSLLSAAQVSQPSMAGSKSGFFSRTKKENKQKISSAEAKTVELIADDAGTSMYAFGLKWRSLVKLGGKEQASEIARKAKANAMVFRQHQIGYGVIPKNATNVYSAAALASKYYSGHALFAIRVTPDLYWLCVVKNGVVANHDELYPAGDAADVADHIRGVFSSQQAESLVLFTDMQHVGIAGSREFTLPDILDVIKSETELVESLNKTGSTIPKPVMIAVGAALLVVGAKQVLDYYEIQSAEKARAALAPQDVPPEVAWAPVWDKFIKSQVVPSGDGMAVVRASIGDLPVLWKGWELKGVRCSASPPVEQVSERAWSCESNYYRTPVGLISSQMATEVKQRFPSNLVSFPTVSTMSVVWNVKENIKTYQAADEFPSKDSVKIKFYDRVQKLLPAFQGAPDIELKVVDIPAPKKQDGSDQPKPANIPNVFSSDVVLRGPLRSIDKALTQVHDVEWTSVGIQTDTKSEAGGKSINASALTVEITGKIVSLDKVNKT